MERSGFGNTVRLTLVTAAAGGALALTSCSAETPAPAPTETTIQAPQDTLPKVLADASHDDPSRYKYLSTSSISTKTYYGEDYTGADNDRYNTIEGLSGSEGTIKSFPILEVSLGQDKQLHYSAAPELPQEEKATLLGAVAANDSLIRAAMTPAADGKTDVDKLRFRIYAPDTTGTYSPTSQMEYLPKDPNNADKPSVYYTLPASDILDTESLAAMDRHEFLHATLGHERADWLSPEAARRMDAACATLQQDVVAQAFKRGNAKNDLQSMIKHVDAQYRPAYQKVLGALKNGTFGDLPVRTPTEQLPHCTTQTPIKAATRTADQMGIDTNPLVDELMDENSPLRPQMEALGDGWEDTLSDYTDLAFISESGYLPRTSDNKLKGHPADNAWETAVSTLNCALTDTDGFATSMKRLPKNISGAMLTIIDVSADAMKLRHPDVYDQEIKPMLDQLAQVR